MKRILPATALCIGAMALSYAAAVAQIAPKPTPTPTSAPSAAASYCRKYDPKTLEPKGDAPHVTLETQGFAIGTFASRKDAENGKRVADHFDTECLIGLSSQLSGQYQYVYEYFEGSGPGGYWPDPEDCMQYAPQQLSTQTISGANYLLSSNKVIANFATPQDAERALLVAKDHFEFCFVGRHDSGGNAQDVMTYFH